MDSNLQILLQLPWKRQVPVRTFSILTVNHIQYQASVGFNREYHSMNVWLFLPGCEIAGKSIWWTSTELHLKTTPNRKTLFTDSVNLLTESNVLKPISHDQWISIQKRNLG